MKTKNVVVVRGLSNVEFLDRYARAGCIGLSGGTGLVDKVIARAERHLDERGRWSPWTHAFLFEGRRADGFHWIIESNFDIARRHVRIGAQENRISKFAMEHGYTTLAVLDFGLSEEQTQAVLREALELVSGQSRYSFGELVSTVFGLRHSSLRGRENVFAREHSFYCSAFVQYIFKKAGIELAPGVEVKRSTPEDIARSPLPHTIYILRGKVARSEVVTAAKKIRRRIGARIRKVRRKT